MMLLPRRRNAQVFASPYSPDLSNTHFMKIQLIIFDWAGTLLDFGCRAPLNAFLDAFAAAGLPISEEVARRPMGAHKRDHAREILHYPEVAMRVRNQLQREPDDTF